MKRRQGTGFSQKLNMPLKKQTKEAYKIAIISNSRQMTAGAALGTDLTSSDI